MIYYILPLFLHTAGLTPAQDCAQNAREKDDHTADVCNEWVGGMPAYSVTSRASLIPGPASQQVLVFKADEGWKMRIAGYAYDTETGAVATKRREIALPDADAQMIKTAVNRASINELGKLEYYGSPNVICTDGANYEVAMAQGGERYSASQHSCADPSALHNVMGVFRTIALKHDASFDGMLSQLKP